MRRSFSRSCRKALVVGQETSLALRCHAQCLPGRVFFQHRLVLIPVAIQVVPGGLRGVRVVWPTSALKAKLLTVVVPILRRAPKQLDIMGRWNMGLFAVLDEPWRCFEALKPVARKESTDLLRMCPEDRRHGHLQLCIKELVNRMEGPHPLHFNFCVHRTCQGRPWFGTFRLALASMG